MGVTNLRTEDAVSYSHFACVGTGFSAIGLGATLHRWYGIDNIAFFEKYEDLGGTWFINQYPGIYFKLIVLTPWTSLIQRIHQVRWRMTIGDAGSDL